MTPGVITCVIHQSYGFLRADDGSDDVFFHRHVVQLNDRRFDQVLEGLAVLFDAEDAPRGPRAVKVIVVDVRPTRAALTGPADEASRVCRDCGNPFILTASEQQFFIDRQLHQPRRCRECRRLTREHRRAGRAR